MIQFLNVSTRWKLYKTDWYDNWATDVTTEKYDFNFLQRKESFLYSHGVVKITL